MQAVSCKVFNPWGSGFALLNTSRCEKHVATRKFEREKKKSFLPFQAYSGRALLAFQVRRKNLFLFFISSPICTSRSLLDIPATQYTEFPLHVICTHPSSSLAQPSNVALGHPYAYVPHAPPALCYASHVSTLNDCLLLIFWTGAFTSKISHSRWHICCLFCNYYQNIT